MNTKRVTSAAPELPYKIYAGTQEISVPPAYAQQYQFSLFRIRKDEHIVINNIQYRVINKEYTPLSVNVNTVLFANPAEPYPKLDPHITTSDSTEEPHYNDPTIIGSATVERLGWSSAQEGSYLRVGDIYRFLIGRDSLITRVRHTDFTETRFTTAMVIREIIDKP